MARSLFERLVDCLLQEIFSSRKARRHVGVATLFRCIV